MCSHWMSAICVKELTQVLASLDVEKQALQGLADRKSILSGDLQQLENQIQTRRDELQDLAKPVPATVPALKTAPVPVLPGVTDPSPLASAPAQLVGAATQETGAVSSSATKPTAAPAAPAVPSTFGLRSALFLGSRWWFWTILGILVFLALGFVVKRWSHQS